MRETAVVHDDLARLEQWCASPVRNVGGSVSVQAGFGLLAANLAFGPSRKLVLDDLILLSNWNMARGSIRFKTIFRNLYSIFRLHQ
jgi:hypothetical protein